MTMKLKPLIQNEFRGACVALILGVLSLTSSLSFAKCLEDNNDGTLTDPATGLIWQSCAIGQAWVSGSCSGKATKLSWEKALLAAHENRFQNRGDWILPTEGQFKTLLVANCGRWKSDLFWSSSPYAGSSDEAWSVSFSGGDVGSSFRSDSNHVRLVRAGHSLDIGVFRASLEPVLEPVRAQASYDLAKRANSVDAYTKFLSKYPNSKNASEAKAQVRSILEPSIIRAEASFKCEEARQIDRQIEAAGISKLSDFDGCVDKRKFNNILNLKNPQQMYLEAVKYENGDQKNRAKRIYLTVMDKFASNPVAMKAADRLVALKDVEAVESASASSRAAVERAREDASQRQRDYCSGKYSCFASCTDLKGDSHSRCFHSCNSQYSGC